MRATVARTRACTTSSVSSSSSKITTSFTLRTPRFRSSPSATISRITMGEREMALSTRFWPRSMRLAISTSPSRVSSGTVPISRRYMRTGSLVFSSVPGREVELDVLALFQLEILVGAELRPVEQIDALGADGGDQIVDVVGGGHLLRHHVVDVAVGQIALFLARVDQVCDVVFEFVVNSQISLLSPVIFRVTGPVRLAFGSPPVSRVRTSFDQHDRRSWDDAAARKRFSLRPVRAPIRRTRRRERSAPAGYPGAVSTRMTHLRSSPQKTAVSSHCSEQDVRASGFAWVAREPQLMCGAKGRASSQRSIDYHISSRRPTLIPEGESAPLRVSFSAGRADVCLFPPWILLFRRSSGPHDSTAGLSQRVGVLRSVSSALPGGR